MTRRFAILFALFLPALAFAGPNDIIVKFADPGYAQAARIQSGGQLARTLGLISAELWTVEGDRAAACEALEDMPGVIYAVPDRRIEVSVTPNDSAWAKLWQHYQANDRDMDTTEAWDVWTGDSTFVVGVIDTGIRYHHPDLFDNLYFNPGEIWANGIDDDGNGYIDDVNGWDFGNPGFGENTSGDGNGHGSHVSGIIGARGNNGIGVAGIAWRVKLLPAKFTFGVESWGLTSAVVEAMEYCLMMGVKVINGSFATTYDDPPLHEAVTACSNAGILMAFAAANDSKDLDCCPVMCNAYPAGWDDAGIISVGSSTLSEVVSSFSNYGVTKVDLFAPGSSIYSTWYSPNIGYRSISGTSMAAPQVAGTAALIWSLYPNLTRDEVKQSILGSVEQFPAYAGKCVTGGRLNVANAMAYAATFGAGGGGPMETNSVRPVARPWRDYDVQGRRVEGKRSGVVFSDSAGVTRKRVIVK